MLEGIMKNTALQQLMQVSFAPWIIRALLALSFLCLLFLPDTPERHAKHLMQRTLNKCDMSLSLSKAASLALGIPAHGCSDAHIWIDMWAIYDYAQHLSEKRRPADHQLHDTDDIDLEATPFQSHGSWIDEPAEIGLHDDPYLHHGMRSFEVDSVYILVANAEHYAYRGLTLDHMSYDEYALTIQIVKAPKPKDAKAVTKEHPGAGRPHCRVFHFAEGHPLLGHYAQQERAKLMSPKRAGNPAPKFPHKMPPNTIPSAAWKRQYQKACAFYEAIFKPWNQFNPPELTIESFESYVDMLETEAKRTIVSVETNSNDLGLDAFLREGSKRSDATSEDRKTFERRLCAHGILSSIDNLANGIDITKHIFEANKHLRFRNRHLWNEKETADYALHREKPHEPSSIEKEMDAIRSRQEARKRSETRVQHAVDNEQWMETLLSDLKDASQSNQDITNSTIVNAPPEYHMDQENADRVLRALEKEKLEIFDVEENFSEPALTSTPPYATAMIDDQLPRSSLKRIDNISEAACDKPTSQKQKQGC